MKFEKYIHYQLFVTILVVSKWKQNLPLIQSMKKNKLL